MLKKISDWQAGVKTPDERGTQISRNRTVLFVIGSLDIGGAERHLAILTPALAKLGWRPVIYCLTSPGKLAGEVAAAGVEVIAPPFAIAGQRFLRFPLLLLSCAKLMGLMLSLRPWAAHFFLPMSYVIGAPLAIIARVPHTVMSRRSLNHYQRKHPAMRQVEHALHRKTTAILANSKSVLRDLIAEGCNPAKLRLIYNGIIVSDRIDRSKRTGPLTLVIVANLIPYKGHADLIHALSEVASCMPPGWKLICVGRDQGIGSVLRELAQIRGLAANIEFACERTDSEAILDAADVGLLCSHEEGFSNALLEGMERGLPMIATDVGGNAEAVTDGVEGLIVPARNPRSLGQAILRLANDKALRLRMGEAARAKVVRQFSLGLCVSEYDAFYSGLGIKAVGTAEL